MTIASGTRFCCLEVIKVSDKRAANGGLQYVCKCYCGNEKIAIGSNLTKGAIKSCGCYRKRLARKKSKLKASIRNRFSRPGQELEDFDLL